MKIDEVMTPLQMLQVISGLCKTYAKGGPISNPVDEFNFIASTIDTYINEQDKGSEGANQDD